MSDDAEISRQYRQLGAEEPPRALDEAILAAARREAGARPGAPAAHSNRQRWYAPLATAAVLVLAVAVTLNMQLERPGIESPAPQRVDQPAVAAALPDAKEELKLKATADLKRAPKTASEADAVARRKETAQAAPAASEPQAFSANKMPERAASRADARSGAHSDDTRDLQVPSSTVTGEHARKLEDRTSRDAQAGERAPQIGALGSLAKRSEGAAAGSAQPQLQERQAPPPPAAAAAKPMQATVLGPDQELERIADLRRQGRHDEADKALAEFRKRYPDFRIPEATRERVERR